MVKEAYAGIISSVCRQRASNMGVNPIGSPAIDIGAKMLSKVVVVVVVCAHYTTGTQVHNPTLLAYAWRIKPKASGCSYALNTDCGC